MNRSFQLKLLNIEMTIAIGEAKIIGISAKLCNIQRIAEFTNMPDNPINPNLINLNAIVSFR